MKSKVSIYSEVLKRRALQSLKIVTIVTQSSFLLNCNRIYITLVFCYFFYRHAASGKKGQRGQRRRRNSDTFLFLSPKKDEVTSMKLEQAENKWNLKVQVLEREIEKLKTEVAKAEDLQRHVEEKCRNGK